MDELTRELYAGIDLDAERKPKPLRRRPNRLEIARHRIDLCGTSDLMVQIQGGDPGEGKRRRLIEAIRWWKP